MCTRECIFLVARSLHIFEHNPVSDTEYLIKTKIVNNHLNHLKLTHPAQMACCAACLILLSRSSVFHGLSQMDPVQKSFLDVGRIVGKIEPSSLYRGLKHGLVLLGLDL